MKGRLLIVVSALSIGMVPAAAERDLFPSIDSEPAVCVDRPEEPIWMQEIVVREAYKRVLVQDIYRTQNMERIVATGVCNCETRFPAWAEAEVEFRESFDSAKRWEMLEASDSYNRRSNSLRPEAMRICIDAGIW